MDNHGCLRVDVGQSRDRVYIPDEGSRLDVHSAGRGCAGVGGDVHRVTVVLDRVGGIVTARALVTERPL